MIIINFFFVAGGIGPCPQGHHFVVSNEPRSLDEPVRAQCKCKPNYVPYEKDGFCYRVHTQGPCQQGEMFLNSTSCVPIPCKRGRLFFSRERTCYKIGTRGPCPSGQVVLYDYSARPSIDGITYNGVCGCTTALKANGKCLEASNNQCEEKPGFVLINKICYALYQQGPCAEGEWLVPRRVARGFGMWKEDLAIETEPRAICECRPGYSKLNDYVDIETNNLLGQGKCQPPTVILARFLNKNIKSVSF